MTKKVRYTYRPPEELYDALAKEANRKQMAINSVITTILWENYFPNKKQTNARRGPHGEETNNAPTGTRVE